MKERTGCTAKSVFYSLKVYCINTTVIDVFMPTRYRSNPPPPPPPKKKKGAKKQTKRKGKHGT